MGKSEWERQSKEMERLVKEVEGEDDRGYLAETAVDGDNDRCRLDGAVETKKEQ